MSLGSNCTIFVALYEENPQPAHKASQIGLQNSGLRGSAVRPGTPPDSKLQKLGAPAVKVTGRRREQVQEWKDIHWRRRGERNQGA